MPLANNSTGGINADQYSPQNPAMVTGILAPTDGDVYVYGYDANKQQVIIRKIAKQAQVPHKGARAHSFYSNNLLASYQKIAVQPIAGIHSNSVSGNNLTLHTQTKDQRPSGGALHGKAGPGGAANNAMGQVMNYLTTALGFGGSNWPIARFHFYVMIGGAEIGFQTVEGLEASIGVIEYRDGNSPFFGKEKMPGLVTYEKVTLKKGTFSNDTNSNSWFKEISQDRLYTKRRTIIIALMDHDMIPQFIWRYENCFLTKVVPSNLDAESETEVALEEVEFVGRAWYMETLAGSALGVMGSAASAAGVNLSF